VNSIAWVYFPYLAFLGPVIGGLHYNNIYVVIIGLVFLYAYDPKPVLEIICKRSVYYKCIFEKEQSK
jgi:hypothetical protein